MRVLIVGVTGVLGKEIVRLLSPEHQVIGASRNGQTCQWTSQTRRPSSRCTSSSEPLMP
jgi:dTDP-4-dehydrorhamnose reductase